MLEQTLFGNLRLDSIPFDNPIIRDAGIFMAVIAVGVIATITYLKKWKHIWNEWITTTDHKKIGIMYIILAFVMLLR
ncbi:MAG: cytochrome o ubiquinol oxidase subunit I, partial [Coxiellaceae bacterium]|nr:cytochrome o ubiquinol oxidase subunit I [Coxiellaceae bacterium]